MAKVVPCSVDACERRAEKRGLCSTHYSRLRRHGDPLGRAARKPPLTVCPTCGADRVQSPATGIWRCQPCTNRRTLEWRKRNPDGARAIRRRDYETHKDRWGYGPEERERIAARMRDYRLKDPEGVRARERASRQAQSLETRQHRAQEAHARAAQRRARERNAVCGHGPDCATADLLAGLRRQDCRYCGAAAEHIDHYVPLKRGGLHCRDNLVPACALCNLSKGARTPEEWTEHLRRRGAA